MMGSVSLGSQPGSTDAVMGFLQALADPAKFAEKLAELKKAEDAANAAIVTHNETLAKASAALKAVERETADSMQSLQSREQQLAISIASHERDVAAANEDHSARADQLNKLQAELKEKDERLSALNEQLAERESALAAEKERLAGHAHAIANVEMILARREKEAADLKSALEAKHAALQAIVSGNIPPAEPKHFVLDAEPMVIASELAGPT